MQHPTSAILDDAFSDDNDQANDDADRPQYAGKEQVYPGQAEGLGAQPGRQPGVQLAEQGDIQQRQDDPNYKP